MINCEVCFHIKYVSKSVNSAGLLQKGMFSTINVEATRKIGRLSKVPVLDPVSC